MKRSLDHLTALERSVWTSAFATAIAECDGDYAQLCHEDRREWLESATTVADNAVAALQEMLGQLSAIERHVRTDLTGFVYELPPIDFWEGWSTPEEVDMRSHREHLRLRDEGLEFHSCLKEVSSARKEIDLCAHNRDGDSWREGPYVSALPCPPHSQLIVAMKGHSNGTTYVWSTLALPWLDTEAFAVWIPAGGAIRR